MSYYTDQYVKNSRLNKKEKMIDIEIEMSEELFSALCKYAHSNDLTFNDAVIKILQEQIKRYEN